MKKKVQKRIIGRAAKMYALHEKREPHVGPSLFGHWHEAVHRLVGMMYAKAKR